MEKTTKAKNFGNTIRAKILHSARKSKNPSKTKKKQVKEFDPIHNNWFHISIYPSENSISVYVDDITEREVSQKQKEVQRIQQEILAETAREIVGVNKTKKALEMMCEALWQGIDCQKINITGEKIGVVKGDENSSSTANIFDIELNNSKWGEIRLETGKELKENDIQFLESVKSMLANSIQRIDREKKLKKYQKIVEVSDEGLYLTNSQSEIEFVNNYFLEITDLKKEEVLGKEISEILDLETDENENDSMDRLIQGEKSTIDEKGSFEKPDGDKLYYKNKFKLLYPEKDGFKGTLGLLEDITDHEEKKEDLRKSRNKSERKRNRLIQNLPGAAFRIEKNNNEWDLNYISEGSEELFGKKPEEIEKNGWESLIFEEDIGKIKKILTKQDNDSLNPINFRVENSNGQIKWIMAKGSKINSENDKKAIEGIFIDITDWKEYKKDLNRTKILVEASPEPMFILNNDLEIKIINKAARNTLNVKKGELTDKTIETAAKKIIIANRSKISQKDIENLNISKYLKGKGQLQDLKQNLTDFMENDQEETSFETEIDLITGSMIYGRFEVRKIFDEKGEVEGLAGVVHDITDMEKKKRSQKDKLDEFSSLVSHDLRNPLNLAQGYLDLARESEDEDDFEVIKKAHNRMENIIDELLLITTEKDEVDKEEVKLGEVFKEAFYFSGSKRLDYEIVEDAEIYGDRSGLVSIFENLISNSDEHNEGDVKIRLGATEEGFYYEDNGRGIPEEKREKVFEYGISSNNSGIGLSIVRRITEINGWDIKACESSIGGARFEIET